MTTQLKSKCPHCSAEMRVHESLVGQRVRCPACNEPFEVDSVEIASEASLERAPLATETMAPGKGSTASISVGGDRARSSAKQESSVGKLGRFELKEILGQGAFGRVYRAYDPQLDRFVALKVPTFGPRDTHKIQRFLAEAKAAARLRHPNIVPTYESGRIDGQYHIAAQFVAGEPLAQRLEHRGPDFRQAAEWVRQLAEALAYAHRQGIVHRDIKPDNIMIDEQDQPQIMDFGLAKRVNDDAAMTTDGSILGTPAYMSPEQARGKLAEVGPHSDQYSLGVVLYELLTGQKPFEGQTHAVIARVIGEEPASPSSLRPEIPRDLAAICQKAMSKEASRRFSSTAELADDLARWLRGDATVARPISIAERGVRWCRQNPAIASLTSTVAVLLILGIALATTMAWTRANHADRLKIMLADLEQQSNLAKLAADDATRAKTQADENAILANQAKDEARANEQLAKSRADELQRTLDELKTTRTLAAERGQAAKAATEAAEKSANDRRLAEYVNTLAVAAREIGDYRYDEARACLDAVSDDLRDARWQSLHQDAVGRRIKLLPHRGDEPFAGKLYFCSETPVVAIDNDQELRLLDITSGAELFLQRHPRERSAAHAVVFHSGSLYVIYRERIVPFDAVARQRRAPIRIRATYNDPLSLPSKQVPRLFTISEKCLAVAVERSAAGYMPYSLPSAPDGGADARLYDNGIVSQINLANGLCTFGPSMLCLGFTRRNDGGTAPQLEPTVVVAADPIFGGVIYQRQNAAEWYAGPGIGSGNRGHLKLEIAYAGYSSVELRGGRVLLAFPDRFEVWNQGSVTPERVRLQPGTFRRQVLSPEVKTPPATVANISISHRAVAWGGGGSRGLLLGVYGADDAISIWSVGANREVLRVEDQRGVQPLTFGANLLGWISDKGIMIWRYDAPSLN
jgi:predicted Zn finger-like uncharacterized protein